MSDLKNWWPDYHKNELFRMYKELTDDEVIEENIRKEQLKKRKEQKQLDTGL